MMSIASQQMKIISFTYVKLLRMHPIIVHIIAIPLNRTIGIKGPAMYILALCPGSNFIPSSLNDTLKEKRYGIKEI